MKRKVLLGLGLLWVAVVLVGLPALRLAQFYWTNPTDPGGEPLVINIPSGTNLSRVADLLAQKKIITRPRIFTALARVRGKDRTVKAGEYALSPSLSPSQVLGVLTVGRPFFHKVTFPEGLTMNQMAALLEEAGLAEADQFLAAANDPDLAASLDIPADNLEGYLFPDTYYLTRGMKPKTIVRMMVAHFKEVMAEAKAAFGKKTGLTDHQSVILASLVEAETKTASERPLVAGVFVGRLKKGMLLQCDPTVIYGLEGFQGDLKKEHLAMPHPYNTYLNPGLPPGPIGNPGASALKAALNPAQTDYYYFVSRNDGTHKFSRTYAQHLKAVNKYQRQ